MAFQYAIPCCSSNDPRRVFRRAGSRGPGPLRRGHRATAGRGVRAGARGAGLVLQCGGGGPAVVGLAALDTLRILHVKERKN